MPLSWKFCTRPEIPPGCWLIRSITWDAIGFELLPITLFMALPAISSRNPIKPPEQKNIEYRGGCEFGTRIRRMGLLLFCDDLVRNFLIGGCGDDFFPG